MLFDKETIKFLLKNHLFKFELKKKYPFLAWALKKKYCHYVEEKDLSFRNDNDLNKTIEYYFGL